MVLTAILSYLCVFVNLSQTLYTDTSMYIYNNTYPQVVCDGTTITFNMNLSRDIYIYASVPVCVLIVSNVSK